MKIKQLILSLLLLTVSTFSVLAQLKIDAEIRPRGDLNNGYKYIRDTSHMTQVYVTQRTRLGFTYQKEKITMRINLQDVRSWGGEDINSASGAFGSKKGVDIFESWINVKLCEKADLKVGRQIFKYDDERLLATRNWNQYGVNYDALLLKYMHKNWEFHASASWNASDDKILGVTDGTDEYFSKRIRTLDFIYLKHRISDNFYGSFLSLLSGYQNPNYERVLNLTSTSGIHLNFKNKKTDVIANAFYQAGSNMYGSETSAWMGTLSAGHTAGKFRLGAGVDILSGNDGSREEQDYLKKDHTFDILYGARFKYFGWMNQFSSVDASTRSGGLVDIYPNITFNFTKESNLQFFLHFFSNQYNVRDYSAADPQYYEKSLGTEYDLMYTHKLMDDLSLQAGFSWYTPTATMEVFKGVSKGSSLNTYWAWLMLTYKPKLM